MFEDEAEAHLPRNVVVVDQMSLLVPTVTTAPNVQKEQHNTITKNFKRFRKVCTIISVAYNTKSTSVPRLDGQFSSIMFDQLPQV